MTSKIQITGATVAESARVLTPEALAFVAALHSKLNPRRLALLEARKVRDAEIAAGGTYKFLLETESVRSAEWQVAKTPDDLQKRHVEITGPADAKMTINALNSGADVFMADFEDSLSPTWENIVNGQGALIDAVRRVLTYQSPEGKSYKLNDKLATLLVRPRGWHLDEKHGLIDGAPVSGSLWDFGLYFFHNAAELLKRGSGPYFYLPKMESHLEARLWNDAFLFAQDALAIPRGSVRATVLVETLPAAFEMDEILYELREHASGENAGRWDYLFSAIKKLRSTPGLSVPDRAQLTMTVPFMRAYTELLIKTNHRRGAHAMGGMAPFIPSRKNPEINAAALAKVRADKERESNDGFDGTWVAHPDLVSTAKEIFAAKLGDKPHQKERLRSEVTTSAVELQNVFVPGGTISEAGARNNISVALQYLASWLSGNGAAAIFNLMEDAATAEISRGQLWLWMHTKAKLDDGREFSAALYQSLRDEEAAKVPSPQLKQAIVLLDNLVLPEAFADFLTTGAYAQL